KEFAQNHLPGSVNIQGNNSFATWCGWILDYDKPFILIADPAKMEDLTRKLMRIGLDNVMGFIANPEAVGIPMQGSTIIDDFALKALIGDSHIQILDVRNATEYKAGHVEGAKHLFVGTLEQNLDKIEPGKQIALYCQAGDRAAIAQSLLQKHGYKNVLNYSAGMAEWKKLGHETTTD
ncbi:MAG TPA: rhodanese-like domain-containing protein, partial [Flavobacterium sp.]|nr:rhodanese-like domain-containing protein [Flavobacterium sp.]